jgi:hypothetical protein
MRHPFAPHANDCRQATCDDFNKSLVKLARVRCCRHRPLPWLARLHTLGWYRTAVALRSRLRLRGRYCGYLSPQVAGNSREVLADGGAGEDFLVTNSSEHPRRLLHADYRCPGGKKLRQRQKSYRVPRLSNKRCRLYRHGELRRVVWWGVPATVYRSWIRRYHNFYRGRSRWNTDGTQPFMRHADASHNWDGPRRGLPGVGYGVEDK